tara:strand:+ start:1815 stop:2411 length:597 start_codon:yes stop_codon:yes gene_type:complete
MRIVAGNFKGTTLYGPKNKKIRPLKDMVRENIFNFLAHSNKISRSLEQSNVLDLYSGTGSFGLECVSRQAKKVIFIEKEKEALNILRKNINKLKANEKTKIFSNDVFQIIKKNEKFFLDLPAANKFDFIFCDPPFKDTNISDLIELIIKKNLLKSNGIIILHRHKNTNDKLTVYLEVIDKRIYGLSKIIFGKLLSTLS